MSLKGLKLKYFCKVKDGTHDTPQYVDGADNTFPLVTSKDITNGILSFDNAKHISYEDYLAINKRSDVEKYDVIMPMIGTVGNPAIVMTDEPFSIKNVALFKTSPDLLKAKYLKYMLDSSYIKEQFNLNSRGGVQSFVSLTVLENLNILMPQELESVINYLEDKTIRVDALIDSKVQLINLLEQQRQSIITEAVTKGLNSNAKMKDSGVEWIGEVPEHWNIISVRNLLRKNIISIQDGNHGELHPTTNDYVNIGIPFVMANNIRKNKINLKDCKFISKDLADTLRIGFSKSGDVLLTHKGTIGEVAIVPNITTPYLMLTPQVTYYRVLNNNLIVNKYLFYYFQSKIFKDQLKLISSMQSTRSYIGLVAQKELLVTLPILEEQIEIIKQLDEESSKLKKIIDKVELQIEKLKEYRQALIYEAVTGKIDIRDMELD